MKALILTAGFGTRLRPISFFYPKPTLPVLKKPILHHLFDYLGKYNIKKIALNLHYKSEKIVECVKNYPHFKEIEFHFSYEHPEILLTAGAIKKCEKFLKGENFFVINGKIITDISLKKLLNRHKRGNYIATIVVKENKDSVKNPYTNVIFSKNRELIGFGEGRGKKKFFFTGVQIFSPEIFKYIPENRPLHTTTYLFPRLIELGKKIGVMIDEGSSWYEFSTPERYYTNNFEIFENKDMLNFSGENLNVGGNSYIKKSIIGDNVEINGNSSVEDSILFGNNFIGGSSRIKKCVILDGIELQDVELEKRIITPFPFEAVKNEKYKLKKGEEILYGKYLSTPINI